MPKISVGRDEEDREKHGLTGTGIVGKHLVGEKEEAHKANPIHFDLARPHVMGIFGKRGTGKCLLPDEKVLTGNGLRRIEDLFEDAREKGEPEILKRNEQLYRFEGEQVQAVKTDFKSESNTIKAGYRKKIDEKLIKIRTESGREIAVTREHPLMTADGWKEAGEIREDECIGVPRRIDLEFKDGELEIPEQFEQAKYSSLNKRESEMLEEGGGKISELSDGSGSYYRMVRKAENEGLVETGKGRAEVTLRGQQELQERKTSNHYRLGKSKPVKLPEKVTPELGEFLAYLIAEGHEQKVNDGNYRIIFTNTNQRLKERFKQLGEKLFDLDIKEMDEDSLYANSGALQHFLEYNGYSTFEDSFGKQIPDFILTAGDETASRFLQKFFDCEATVTDQQIDLVTASEDIASAVNYMLLRFGIVGRTSEKHKYAANTEEQKVRTYYQVSVSGAEQLENFRQEIGFSIDRKSEKLGSIIRDSNTNVDTVPCEELLTECREAMGADRTQIAEHKQSLKAYEDGRYRPSRQKLGEIAERLESHLRTIKGLRHSIKEEPTVEEIEDFIDKSGILWREMNEKLGYSRTDRKFLSYSKHQKNPEKIAEPALKVFEEKHDLSEAREKLDRIRQLAGSDIHWDRIQEIRQVEYSGWVYDLTVEENHSFTAGFGGILCHNSYSMGVIAEELQHADISDNLSTIIVDPMGIYWSMKRPNDRAAGILEDWDIDPEAFDVQVYIPEGRVSDFEEREMPYDNTFTLNPAELSAQEWAMAFGIDMSEEAGILLERLVTKLKQKSGENYGIDQLVEGLDHFDFPDEVKQRLENRFRNARDWGIFGEESSLEKLTQRGELSVLDVSVFGDMGSGWSVRSLVVGLLAKKILRKRMTARRIEEIDEMEGISENEMPIVWMMIDEAHEFLPDKGETAASHPLLRWVKIGREPGVSLVLATQQPAKLHPDALSQADIILSHRLTARQDIDALGNIMHTYMRHDIDHYIDALPDRVGTGLILDDNSERIYPLQVRPRKSWHAGGTPDAFDE